jgi:hypothetical protein
MLNVVVTAWIGQTVRNLVSGPVLVELRQFFHVTIVSPFGDEVIKKNLGEGGDVSHKVFAVPLWRMPSLQGRLAILLYRWNYHSLWQLHHPASPEKWIRKWYRLNRLRFFLDHLGGKIVTYLRSRKNPDQDWLRDFIYLTPLRRQFGPVDVFLLGSTDISKDQIIAYSCKRLGIPVVVIVHSWDVLPARGLLSVRPDRLLVWNKFMFDDAVRLHGMPNDRIDIVGVPQYETYRNLAESTDRQAFRYRLGIPEGSKILTYTCSAEWVVPDEYEIVRELVNSVTNNIFGQTFLIIRLLPGGERNRHYLSEYEDSDLPVRLDMPDPSFAAMNAGTPDSGESIRNFVELMQYSDVVINVASTITLDAILFDRPVVCPKFHLSVASTDWNSIENVYRSSHFSRVVDSGAVHLPERVEEMFEAIDISLCVPDEKSKERRQLAEEMMPNLPSARLIAKAIQRAAKEKSVA